MKLCRLDSAGLESFRQCLSDAREALVERAALDVALRTLAASGVPCDHDIPEDMPSVASRLELGEYLTMAMRKAPPQVVADLGTWTWLTLIYFDVVCPPDSGAPGEDARYILSDDPQRYYRHLLYGPFSAVATHRKETHALAVLLGNPPDAPGEAWEQIASRHLIASSRILQVFAKLYYDTNSGARKTGAASKTPGSIRRFAMVLMQFDCTWDLWEVPIDEWVDMLPGEFDRFLERV